ncbi:MAG TPA: MBL fold metallo-hydrolase [Longimicrobiales bacterium]
MMAAHGGLALREILAPNASPLTLDGTRTYVVGRRRVVVIDPGPAASPHLDAVTAAVGEARVEAVALTHAHEDHAGGAAALAERLGAPLRSRAAGTLGDGDRLETDAGALEAVATPGHTPDHVAFHWPRGGAAFVGDLMLGGLETALVAAPEGDLGAYLASLERVRALGARVLYPAHGPPFTDPAAALDAYARHREERLRQVLAALERGAAGVGEIVDAVYGAGLAADLRGAAAASVVVYLEHLAAAGRVERDAGGRWRLPR